MEGTILVGGVGQLYQGDLDIGRHAVERLAESELGPHVTVEDLFYGAVAVAQFLEDLRPDAAILVAAVERGRPPGTVERRLDASEPAEPEQTQLAVGDAVTGYVNLDLVLDVGRGLGVLPERVVAIELEPSTTGPGEDLSPMAAAALDGILEMVRREVELTPLFVLASRTQEALGDHQLGPSRSLDALHDLLSAVARLDAEDRWGRLSAARDALRTTISQHDTSEGMTHLDWALWWGLIEEVDRLERLTADRVRR